MDSKQRKKDRHRKLVHPTKMVNKVSPNEALGVIQKGRHRRRGRGSPKIVNNGDMGGGGMHKW